MVMVVVAVEVVVVGVGAGKPSLTETAPVLLSPASRAQPRGRDMDILGMSVQKAKHAHYLASSLALLLIHRERATSYFISIHRS